MVCTAEPERVAVIDNASRPTSGEGLGVGLGIGSIASEQPVKASQPAATIIQCLYPIFIASYFILLLIYNYIQMSSFASTVIQSVSVAVISIAVFFSFKVYL